MAMFSAFRLSSSVFKVPSTLKLLGTIHPVATAASNRLLATTPSAPTRSPFGSSDVVPLSKKIVGSSSGVAGGIYSAVRSISASHASSKHDHGKLWTLEKYLSIAMIPIVPLGVMYPNILFDVMMAAGSVMHTHWGFEAIALDYVRPVIFGTIIPKIAQVLVYVLSVFTLVGLLNLTFRGSGIGNTIQTIWSL